MNNEQVKAYLAVCNTGSFSKAAYTMFISKVSVSKLINSLEKEFSTTCFVRNQTDCHLTEEGKKIYDCLKKIVETYNNTLQDINSNFSRYDIKIGVVPEKGEKIVKSIIRNLSKSDLFKATVVKVPYYDFFDLIRQNKINFSFVARPDKSISKKICYKELLQAKYYALHLKSNNYFNTRSITIEDLKETPVYLSPIKKVMYTPPL